MSKRLSITVLHREKGTNEHLKFEKRKNVYSNVYITLFVYCLHTINSENSMIENFFSLGTKGMKITFNGADVKSICTFIYSLIKHFLLGIRNHNRICCPKINSISISYYSLNSQHGQGNITNGPIF